MNLATGTHTIRVVLEVENGAQTQKTSFGSIEMKLDGGAPLGFATYDAVLRDAAGKKVKEARVHSQLQDGYWASLTEALKVLFPG